MQNAITDIASLRVGHAHDHAALTGCTVILADNGAVAGVDQRGGAPGTRETDLLHPLNLVEKVNAILLTGGSAFGLDAAAGVMQYLEEHGHGYETAHGRIPIIPAAVIYDLGIGDSRVRPDARMGYAACQTASSQPPAQGNAGAGTGATVGKILGRGQAMKAGIGTASVEIGSGIRVGALIVVNAFGDVIDPLTGSILAGVRGDADPSGGTPPSIFADSQKILASLAGTEFPLASPGENTVIGVIATNATLTKGQAAKIAGMAHNGIARTIRPAHTMFDGDTLFTLATGERTNPATPLDVSAIGAAAADIVASAILNAIRFAGRAGDLPASRDL